MKLKITCAKCGRYIGEYNGDPFYLMPATAELKPLCEACSRVFRRQGYGHTPQRYRQIAFSALVEAST